MFEVRIRLDLLRSTVYRFVNEWFLRIARFVKDRLDSSEGVSGKRRLAEDIRIG